MANYTWRVGSGDFALAADWTLNGAVSASVPGPSDVATFGNAAGGTVTGTGSVGTLTVTGGASAPWAFAGPVSFANGLNVGLDANSTAAATIASGGTLTLAGGIAYVANLANSNGTLNINAGGRFLTTIAPQSANYLLNIGGNGSATGAFGRVNVAGSGALLDLNGSAAAIGLVGTGTLAISAGGVARFGTPQQAVDFTTTASLSLGRSGTGTITVDGTGSSLQLAGTFYAGRASGSTGTISLTNGASFIQTALFAADAAVIGNSGPVNGTTVTGGTGVLTVASGSTATIGNQTFIGTNGAHGNVTVTGANSRLSINDATFVGGGPSFSGGSGMLSVLAGATARVTAAADTAKAYLQVANSTAGTGTVLVDGAGSLLDVGLNSLTLANAGTGTMTISNGATAKSGTTNSSLAVALGIANVTGSAGTLTVTGTGSTYDAAGYVYLGRGGTGTLKVDQGATFLGGSATVGNGTGANAGAAITIGDGSPTTATPYFRGSGNASILAGSTLHSRNAIFLGNRGGTGTLLLDGASTALADTVVYVGTGTDRQGGSGTVTVQGGSTLRSGGGHFLATGGIVIAQQTGTFGSVNVTGAGSLLDTAGDRLSVGSRGNGSLSISAGARALAGAAYADVEAALSVGSVAGASGSVMINGDGSQLVASGLAVLGGNDSGSGLTAGGTGTVAVNGGLFRAANLAMFAGSTLTAGPAGTVVIGSSAGTAGVVTVDAGASITGAGTVAPGLLNNGNVMAKGGTLDILANSGGTGIFGADTGTLNVAAVGSGNRYQFTGNAATIKVGGAPSGASTITGFTGGDVFDVTSIQSASLSGNVLTVRYNNAPAAAAYTFAGLAGGTSLALTADGTGGMKVIASPDILFDDAYYLARNPDVAAAAIDPYQHYLASGFREGRNPSAVFDTSYYLTRNQDVAAAGINPLLHFEASGYSEGRNPSAAFSLSDYLAANADVKAAGLNPLLHYVASGRAEGRAAFAVYDGPADPLVNAAYYYAANPDVRAAGVNATAHYHASGWREGRNPDALFDTSYYLTQNPDVRAAGVDPLAHFETNGWFEGREPSLLFSDAKYLAAYPDIRAAGIDPLLHYLGSGQFEGRMTFLTGGTAPADPLVDATYYDRQLGATLIPGGAPGAQQAASSYDTTGWQRGLNPDAFFDTTYYLSHNPDVAAAHINPLAHYEVNGWHEGRDPSAQFSTSKYLAAYADVQAAGIDPLLHYVANGQAEGRSAFPV